MWKITNIKGEEEIYYTKDELDSSCVSCKFALENCKLKHTLEEIKQMLEIADKAKSATIHFEYIDKALEKSKEVLND